LVNELEEDAAVTHDYQRKIRDLAPMIGNTPLLAIDFLYRGEKRTLYAKAENLNMTGSIKDRMAFHILKQAFAAGAVKPGDLIAEATSGNTGIAFSAIGRALGHKVVIFMPDWMSAERINLIKSLGADIVLISKEDGGFLGSIKRSEELAASQGNVFLPRQFSNENNIEAHYLSTGPEIWWQLKWHSLCPDAFLAGVGTGGTIMGVGRFLREKHPAIKLYPMEPANSPTLSTGYKVGRHRIQGISDEFIPAIVNLKQLDEVISVDDGDAIIMAQKLASELGLGVGISSGGNFLGALKVQNEMGRDAVVVTILADDNKKYLSTDLLRAEPVREDFMAPDVQLLNVQAFKRVCQTCCNPEECADLRAPELAPGEQLPACAKRSSAGPIQL
jgi:cysteine synthase A